MKANKIAYGLLVAGFGAMLGGCQNSFDTPDIEVPKATMEANTTIAAFKTRYMNDPDQLCGYKDEATREPWIIKGRVVSNDMTGNIYQTLSVQDATGAMTFAVRRAALYNYYPLGQEVVINMSDLWIGQYNYLMQSGWITASATGEPQMGRMAFDLFQTHTELNGLPNLDVKYISEGQERPEDSMYCLIENIDDLPTSPGEDFYKIQGQLVEFRNVEFEDGGKEPYARSQESVSRYITQEGNSLKLCVYNSGYSSFYTDTLPSGRGTVRGILSYYASDPTSTGSNGAINGWQLLLRSREDVIFSEEGSKEKPYTVAQAQEMTGQGRIGWVGGYIVGSVKAGVNNVTSNADIIFGKDAEMDNNLVVAATPEETDWSKCISVSLPQGSPLRRYGNLADNPVVYKQAIKVKGAMNPFLGIPGVEGTGAADSFEIDGVVISPDDPTPGPDEPEGDGSEEHPFSIAQVMASTQDYTEVWIEGYVAGYIPDKTWDGAIFGTTPSPDMDNYKNATNCILSGVVVGESNASNSVPCGLKNTGDVRTTLGISKNPAIYGQRVKVKGDITKYFGVRGVKNVIDFRLLDSPGGDTPEPTPDPGQADGDGTEDKPFSIAQVMASSGDSTGVWIEGYVAGYIPDKTWDGAIFGTTPSPDMDNYKNATNCILSGVVVGESNASNSVPCGLKNTGDVRTTLGISKNPAIYGKRVKVKGDVTKYFGTRGVKNVSEFRILD